jgi:hypothetical protein
MGAALVPPAHVTYLRDTFVADTRRAEEGLDWCARYAIGDAMARRSARAAMARAAA